MILRIFVLRSFLGFLYRKYFIQEATIDIDLTYENGWTIKQGFNVQETKPGEVLYLEAENVSVTERKNTKFNRTMRLCIGLRNVKRQFPATPSHIKIVVHNRY